MTYQHWGLIDYQEAWNRQGDLHHTLVQAKRGGAPIDIEGYLILCEHPAVYTLGRSGKEDHLLIDADRRSEEGIAYYKINRGGDITHHGPGQLVGYPILDLEHWYRDVHRYVRNLEEVIIRVLAEYGIAGVRDEGYTGVWVERSGRARQKICAIGVHFSRWVSMHGFALNVNNDLSLFEHIVPCGITDPDRAVTSMSALIGEHISMEDVRIHTVHHFSAVFEANIKHT